MGRNQRAVGVAVALVAVSTAGCGRPTPYAEPPAQSYSVGTFELATESFTDTVSGAIVRPEFGVASKLRPHMGRYFLSVDYESRSRPVAVISYDLWTRRFNSQPSMIGATVRLNGRNVTIVGVGPRGFAYPNDASVWVPACC